MKKRTFTRFVLLVLIGLGCAVSSSNAQDLSPWTENPYGNEWIDYSKKYVRVTVAKDGFYKIPLTDLPLDFRFPEKLQLWFRGKEVAISVNSTELIFFGQKNDGSGEGLLYRPGPEARLNPYANIFSDLGYYFLTILESGNAKRIPVVNGGALSGTPEAYHLQKDVIAFTNQFSHTTYGQNEELNSSYYYSGNSWTSAHIYGPGTGQPATSQYKDFDVFLKNWVRIETIKPQLEVLVNGTNPGNHNINFYVGSSNSSREANNIITIPQFNKFTGQKRNVEIDYPQHLTQLGQGYLRVKSLTPNDLNDFFGLSYYAITYPQSVDMGAKPAIDATASTTAIPASAALTQAIFTFPATANSQSNISVLNAPLNAMIYDITEKDSPKFITSSQVGSTLTAMVPRNVSKSLVLFIVAPASINSLVNTAASPNLTAVNLKPVYANNQGTESTPVIVNPSLFDYIIITHNVNKQNGANYPEFLTSSVNYAKYRSSPAGGNYNTIVVNIRDIYDQFNFGEPSPIAIKRFVKFMLKDGVRPKHNLLLIGHSITFSGFLKKEIKGEVPTFGDPGSDILLVSGLQQPVPNEDTPAIPVGRINAYTHGEIDNYKAKVAKYESEQSVEWRRNLLQLIGGKGMGQVNEFKGYFSHVNSTYVNSVLTRNILPVKDNAGSYTAVPVDNETIGWINDGVGLISYFGHGNQVETSLFLQEINKTSSPIYTNNSKFPVIYFLGCGVGNNSFNPGRQYFAANWLTASPDKGAIAVMANTALSWIPQDYDHMKKFYEEVFTKSDVQRATIGQIIRSIGLRTLPNASEGGRVLAADPTTVSMIHQMNLMGDPAITILKSNDGSLPVGLFGFQAKLFEDTKVKLEWSTAWEKNNSHFLVERSYNGKQFEEIGRIEGKMDTDYENSYQFVDIQPNAGTNYYRIKSIDQIPGNVDNNFSKIVSVEIPNSNQVVVFPNPVIDKFEIKLNIPTKFKSWRLVNQSGVQLLRGANKTPSIGKLDAGIYILEIITENGDVYKEKIVKK
ncbi:C25 family cysteine peptidase [Dyadobacter sp. CY312]|uniref:putative type IX secretion system sortase PorU2 n=1 Tax=Dyadobacter sp. CY312 TaxID=2907303 RepID=UPI001F3EF89C|nr:C25 family cysteine peptidase [Dyadobacter sp. CY312]MCE7041221.1 C25 family cysteine peptidase [Dyadobacter sp. CY312]